jgi:hypothetical protein
MTPADAAVQIRRRDATRECKDERRKEQQR